MELPVNLYASLLAGIQVVVILLIQFRVRFARNILTLN